MKLKDAHRAIVPAGMHWVLHLFDYPGFHSGLYIQSLRGFEIVLFNLRYVIRTAFNWANPICPIFQNVNAAASSNPLEIKENLIAQLTAPVLWTQTVQNMVAAGASHFTEYGPGKVLQGLVKKIKPEVEVAAG